MWSMSPQRIVVIFFTALSTLLSVPNLAGGIQKSWTDRIAQHLQEEKARTSQDAFRPAYDRYLTQIQAVQWRVSQGNVAAAQKELNRLIQTIAIREGGIPESSALSLLFHISEVTPIEYQSETTKSHLRLIRELFTSSAGISEDLPVDPSYGWTVTPRTAPSGWERLSWWGKSRLHPIIVLGSGVLVLVAVAVVVLLFIGFRGASPEPKLSIDLNPKRLRLK